MEPLVAALIAGLLGSAHCVGMCGGFVALLGVGSTGSVAPRQAAYFLGKTLTYSAFGAVAGGAGLALRASVGAFGGAVGLGLGALMVVAGLAVCGVSVGPQRFSTGRLASRLGPVVGRLVASERRGALVALGAVNGLLPCGLVYGMLAVAATSGGAAMGALTMAVFGLATVPALAVVGAMGARLRPDRRLWMQRLAGVLVVVMGLLTVARSVGAVAPAGHAPHRATEMCGM